jgi:hypothetical protein
VPSGIPKAIDTVEELYVAVGVEPAGNEDAVTSKSVVKSIVLWADAAAAAALAADWLA